MPNGRPGDHPLTDLLVHGKQYFPADMEAMIRQLLEVDPKAFEPRAALSLLCRWERGEDLEAGRAWLRERLGLEPPPSP